LLQRLACFDDGALKPLGLISPMCHEGSSSAAPPPSHPSVAEAGLAGLRPSVTFNSCASDVSLSDYSIIIVIVITSFAENIFNTPDCAQRAQTSAKASNLNRK